MLWLQGRAALPGHGLQKLHDDSGQRPDEIGFRICNSIWLLDDFTSAQAQTAIEFLFGFTLSAGEITTLQEFRTRFDGLTTDGKNAYWHRFEAYTLLVQVGAMTAAQYRTLMGIT